MYSSIKTFILFVLVLINQHTFSQTKRYRFSEQKMGSEFTILLYHSDSNKAQIAASNAFKIADSLNYSFSDYLINSEVSKLSKTAGTDQWVRVSADLMEIIEKSNYAWIKSKGTFDITVGRLTKLWRKNKKDKKLPNQDSLKIALGTTGMKFVQINKNLGLIKLKKKGTQIDLGGIGKGFAAQKMLDYLKSQNITTALCDAAGNMAIGDAPPDTNGWNIAVQIPNKTQTLLNQMLQITNRSISTSGDLYQYFEVNKKKYSHIINPKTGLGITSQKQVTIICENATRADWLSTACCILPTKKALNLAKKENAEILIIESKNHKMIQTKSKKFFRFS